MRNVYPKSFARTTVLIAILCLSVINQVSGQSFISPQFSLSSLPTGYGTPNGISFTSDGNKMFTWEKNGRVHVSNWNNTTKTYDRQNTLVLNISEEVGDWGDYGLVGFALDPAFNTNGYIYLMYVVDRHHLLFFGTGQYNPISNAYNNATIGRITRYTTFVNGSQETIANPATRFVLLGETKSTGIPILHNSHGVGSLEFADDGTLLASTGDGASYDVVDAGSATGTYWDQGLQDGIIRTEENCGSFRSQMLNSHSGKILRLDPATGNGITSNPFYDAVNPRSAKSRVWALGFRNPFRFIRKPGSGSNNPAVADLGEIYIGDVGWETWEELNIISEPGVNGGWPIYEGFTEMPTYPTNILNRDEPNPLFGINGCTQAFYTFNNLLKQPTADNNRFLPNPCNPATSVVYANSNRFIHHRPAMTWKHTFFGTQTYVGIFNGNNAAVAAIGTPESGVSGSQFMGNCAAGACWFKGSRYGVKYNDTYFIADFVSGWIKNITVPGIDRISAVEGFGNNVGPMICMKQSPKDSLIYLVNYERNDVMRLNYGGNRLPVSVINSSLPYGPSPHTVTFSSNGSFDPDNGALTYLWNFGDGTTSTLANPSHNFGTGGNTSPASFTVTLTVTDIQGGTGVITKRISINNTPPSVSITSPVNNSKYIPGPDTTYQLRANVTDDQAGSTLKYAWQTTLRHNIHEHHEPIDTNRNTSATIARVGCSGDTYYYFISLTVTDAYGMVTMDSIKLFPQCSNEPPEIITQPLSQTSCEGTAVTFTSAVSDAPIPSVQWQVSTDNGINWTNISGATSATLQITPAFSANGNQYRAVWTNSFASQNSNAATLTVTAGPVAPSGIAIQAFCIEPTVANLTATGSGIKWYSSATGGTPLAPANALVNGNHYYASQTIGGCESIARFDVTVTVSSSSIVTLNASGSSGTISSYAWTRLSGPNVPVINSPASASTTVTGLVQGSYVFQLSLNGGASTSQVLVNVNAPASPITANAGSDRILTLPAASVSLDGNGSTGAINSYTWTRISGPNTPVIANPGAVSTNVTGLVQGVYTFQLAVSDGIASATDIVQVTVNAAPTGGSSPVIAFTNTRTTRNGTSVNTLTAVPAGALLVLTIADENDASKPSPTVNSSPALTWTKRVDAQAATSGNAEIYTAVFPAGGNLNITTVWSTGSLSTVVYGITNYDAVSYIGASAVANAQTVPSATITTTLANSLIIGVTSDWNATIGTSRVYRDAATETFYESVAGAYTAYHYRKPTTATGNYTEGLTSPTGLKAGTALLEIKGAAGATGTSLIAYAGPNQNVFTAIPPSGPASQTFCNASTVSNLVATGTNINWYDVPSGGTALLPNTPLISGNHYYASQTLSGCESLSRLDVTVTVTENPVEAPTGNVSQGFCGGATIASLTVTGTGIKWYSSVIGGTPLPASNSLVDGIHYYASQSIGGCESATRLDVTVSITTSVGPPSGNNTQDFCNTATVADLIATGTGIKWYSTISGGTALLPTVVLSNGSHYFASQTAGACESATRLDVTVSVTTVGSPTGNLTQVFCGAPTLAGLTATGTGIKWYSQATGGTPLSLDNLLTNGSHYYASQTIGSCESPGRLDVTVNIAASVNAPSGIDNQVFCGVGTVANLTATGSGIKWYSSATGGTPLAPANALVNGNHYYASQTIGSCESENRLDVSVTVTPSPTVTLNASGSSGTISSYAWTRLSGPNVPVINSPASASTTVTGLVQGSYVFQLSLNGGASTSQVLVNVNAPASPITANAGSDRILTLPAASVSLDGNGSTGAINSYTWTRISGPNTPVIANPGAVSTNVTGLVQGVYTFQLAVSDGIASATDIVQVTVNAAPTGGSSPVIAFTNTRTTRNGTSVNTLTAVPAGALLVLTIADENDASKPSPTVNSSPALTWTKRVDAQAATSGNAEIYTAVFPAGGNLNITTVWSTGSLSTVVYGITNYDAVSYIGASAVANAQTVPSATITTTLANSLIIGVTSDWNARSGTNRVYRDAATETLYNFVGGAYSGYHYRKPTITAQAYTEGLTAPTAMRAGTALLEIKGPASAVIPLIAFAGNNQTLGCDGEQSLLTGTSKSVQPMSVDNTLTLKPKLEVYPNPTNGRFKLVLNNMVSGKVMLRITDIRGMVVMIKELPLAASRTTTQLDLGALSNGIYFIQVIHKDGVLTGRVIRE